MKAISSDASLNRRPSGRNPPAWRWILQHPEVWYGGFALQAVLMALGGGRELRDFALTHDFAGYWQAVWWMGAHHRWYPPDSVFGWPFFANAGEWIMVPIGFLGYALWPHPSLLLFVQTGALLAAEIIAWHWIAETCREWPSTWRFAWLGAAMVSLAANPWILKSDWTDFHSECLLALATVGAAWALHRTRWRALGIWILVALGCGTVGALVVIGVAGSALLQRQWRVAGWIGAAGFATLLCLSHWHLDQGSLMAQSYRYLAGPQGTARTITPWTVLAGVARHPGRAVAAFGHHVPLIVANWWGALGLGWGNVSVLGPLVVVSVVNNLVKPGLPTHFAAPGFQNVILYPLLSIGGLILLRDGQKPIIIAGGQEHHGHYRVQRKALFFHN